MSMMCANKTFFPHVLHHIKSFSMCIMYETITANTKKNSELEKKEATSPFVLEVISVTVGITRVIK